MSLSAERATEFITTRLSKSEKREVQAIARRNKWTISQTLRLMVVGHLGNLKELRTRP